MRPTFWNARAIPAAARSWAGRSVTSNPRNRTRPSSGRRNPLMTSNSVVLPAPLGPMIPTISSSLTSIETSYNARIPPKLTETPSTSSMGFQPRGRGRGRPFERRRGAQPPADRAEQLPEPARMAGQREEEQQRAEDEGGEIGGHVGQQRNRVHRGRQVQLVEQIVGEGEERRGDHDAGPAAEPADHRHH